MVIPCLGMNNEKGVIIPTELEINGEIAYQCIINKNYYITKTGKLYSIFVKGGQGKININNPRKVAYGQDKDGYYRVVLSNNGNRKYIKIHQLVCEQFIGHVTPPFVVNHKDGNKHNNNVNNLEIITDIENIHHAWKNGLSKKENNPNRIPIDVYDHQLDTIYHYTSIADANKAHPDLSKRYISELRKKNIKFTYCLLKKIIIGNGRKEYYIECYYNGELYKIFKNIKEASKYFNKARNTISESFKSMLPNKINRYTLTFPNVSTIESIA